MECFKEACCPSQCLASVTLLSIPCCFLFLILDHTEKVIPCCFPFLILQWNRSLKGEKDLACVRPAAPFFLSPRIIRRNTTRTRITIVLGNREHNEMKMNSWELAHIWERRSLAPSLCLSCLLVSLLLFLGSLSLLGAISSLCSLCSSKNGSKV